MYYSNFIQTIYPNQTAMCLPFHPYKTQFASPGVTSRSPGSTSSFSLSPTSNKKGFQQSRFSPLPLPILNSIQIITPGFSPFNTATIQHKNEEKPGPVQTAVSPFLPSSHKQKQVPVASITLEKKRLSPVAKILEEYQAAKTVLIDLSNKPSGNQKPVSKKTNAPDKKPDFVTSTKITAPKKSSVPRFRPSIFAKELSIYLRS